MGKFLIRVVINAIAIAVTASILPGITVVNNDLGTLLVIGLIFGIVNAVLRPLVILLTCPAVILTLGLFVLVINGLLLQVVAWLSGDRLMVENLGWAIVGGIIMGLTSMVIEIAFGLREKREGRRPDTPIEYRRLR